MDTDQAQNHSRQFLLVPPSFFFFILTYEEVFVILMRTGIPQGVPLSTRSEEQWHILQWWNSHSIVASCHLQALTFGSNDSLREGGGIDQKVEQSLWYFDLFDQIRNPCQRQFCHYPLFPREKEYSVKYMDCHAVNFTEYYFFPWKRGWWQYCRWLGSMGNKKKLQTRLNESHGPS